MIVIRFDECVPKVAVWSVLNGIKRLEVGIYRLTEGCRDREFPNGDAPVLSVLGGHAVGKTVLNGRHHPFLILISILGLPQGYSFALLDGYVVQVHALRQMLLKDQSEFLLSGHPIQFLRNPRTEPLVGNLFYQVVYSSHIICFTFANVVK